MSCTDPLRVPRDPLAPGPVAPARRTVLRIGALALAVLGVAGCDSSGGGRDPSAPASSGPGPAEDEVADTELAAAARGHLDATLALIEAVTARHPAAAPLVGALVRAHGSHRDLLVGAAPEPEPPAAATSPAEASRAWSVLRRRETALQAELGALALRASSGPFARLLAVMAASVAAHLAALPATLPPAPGAGR